jgi:uncharacterized protein (DUF924 family)
MASGADDVLRFWFPAALNGHAQIVQQFEWWFRGGANAAIIERFPPLLAQASRGELDGWASAPRTRLALILVLDQFPRAMHSGTPQAFSQDEKARALTLEGIEVGHYAALESPWEKTFFFLPLGHSEELADLDLAVRLADELARQTSDPERRRMLEFSANQARGHRDVVARFGRQPHRNAILGRASTPEELEYLARGELVHQRRPPGD